MSAIYYELPDYGDDFLMHHGIKGMKWGIRRTAEQLGHFTKKTYKTAQKLRDDRIAKAKENAIATGDYNKIKKYEKYMSEVDINRAKTRMESNIRLRELDTQSGPSKRVQKKIDKAVRKGDFKQLLKLEKNMTDKDFKAAYDRLDTRRKLKDMNDQSMVEKGIKVIETVGRVGKAVYTIKDTAAGFRRLKNERQELKEKKMQRKENAAKTKDPFKQEYKKDLEETAKEKAREAYDNASGSDADKAFAYSKTYNNVVNTGIETYEQFKRRKGYGWTGSTSGEKKKK